MNNQENNKKLRNKIISSLATVILVLTVCICGFVVVQVLGNGYASLGGYSFFRVVTPSMEPTISVGEIIITKQMPIESVKEEDIISFRSQSADMFGTVITHRVVEIDNDENGKRRLLTKGDANLSVDGRYVLESNFIGKVVFSSGNSFIASVISFITGDYGFIACIVLPALLILALILSSSIKNIRRDMENLVKTTDKQEDGDTAQTNAPEITSQEYDEMYQRIRDEVVKELMESEDTPNTTTE